MSAAVTEAPSRPDLIEAIANLTVLEMCQLTRELEEKHGISGEAKFIDAPILQPIIADVPEQTEFTVMLLEIGPNKVNVIKAVRELTNLGLVDSKNLVEKAPIQIKEGVDKVVAAAALTKLTEAGAKAEMK